MALGGGEIRALSNVMPPAAAPATEPCGNNAIHQDWSEKGNKQPSCVLPSLLPEPASVVYLALHRDQTPGLGGDKCHEP